MLINIPAVISPALLAALHEMGHGDTIVLGDGNFPGASIASKGGAKYIRADGHGIPAFLDAVLSLIPADSYVETPIMLMQKMDCDAALEIPIWAEYKAIAAKRMQDAERKIGYYERFEFYRQAEKAYCVVQTGEASVYANIIIQKGVIK